MIQQLIGRFKKFSKENWWVYILLTITLGIVVYTGRGNFYEITILFFYNLLAALFNMLMIDSYKDGKFQEGSIFIVTANFLYCGISLYSYLHDGNVQYLVWQFSFLATGIQTAVYYNYQYNIRLINMYSICVLNVFLFTLLVVYFRIDIFQIIQSFGLACITFGLVVKHDVFRYFILYFGTIIVTLGTLSIIFDNYFDGAILGVSLAYGLLALTSFSFYSKLFPVYFKRLKILR